MLADTQLDLITDLDPREDLRNDETAGVILSRSSVSILGRVIVCLLREYSLVYIWIFFNATDQLIEKSRVCLTLPTVQCAIFLLFACVSIVTLLLLVCLSVGRLK